MGGVKLVLSGAVVDLDHCRVEGGSALTGKEVELLRYLADRPGQVVTREELLEQVWGYRPGVVSRTIDTTVRRLRKKIERDPRKPESLHTMVGEGYRLVLEGPGEAEDPAPGTGDVVFATAGGVRFLVDPMTALREAFGKAAGVTLRKETLARQLARAASPGQLLMGADVWDEVAFFADALPGRVRHLGMLRLTPRGAPVAVVQLAEEGAVLPRPGLPPLQAVPRPIDELVGRSGEFERARKSLARPGLVTLHGFGGVGKTRLAQELAGNWEGPCAWVELAAEREPMGVVACVAAALGVVLPERSALEAALATRPGLLLVLDNTEQVDLAQLIHQWREAAPELHMLVTSRHRLELRGERVVPMGGLPVEEAAELFSVRSGRAVDEDVRNLVERLEGLPLAIELAAARARLLSPAQLAERLPRVAPLDAVVAWSWELLERSDQQALAELCCFAAPFTLEAAEAVLESALLHLEALERRALLVQQEGRFRLPKGVLDFAAPHCSTAAAERHARWFSRHGGFQEQPWSLLDTWQAEQADLLKAQTLESRLAALQLTSLRGPLDRLPELAEGLEHPAACYLVGWGLRSSGSEHAHEAVERGLTLAEEGPWRGRLLAVKGLHRKFAGETQAAMALFDEAIAAAETDLWGELRARMYRANVLSSRWEEPDYEPLLQQAEMLGDTSLQAKLLNNMGLWERRTGRSENARQCYESALDLHRQLGNRQSEAIALSNLGAHHHLEGDLDTAGLCFEQSARLFGELGEPGAGAMIANNQAELLLAQGRSAEALLERALKLAHLANNPAEEARALGLSGQLEDALKISQDHGDRHAEARWLLAQADRDEDLSQARRAKDLFDALGDPQAAEDAEALLTRLSSKGT